MAIKSFNYRSSRAEKARIGVLIGKNSLALLNVSVILLIIAGISFVIIGVAVGWALIGLAAIPAMVAEWKNGELSHLKPDLKANTIDGLLDADILGLLPPAPSPYDVATMLAHVYGGQFFAVRFGVGPGFLQQIASKETTDTEALWQAALDIRSQLNSPQLTAGMLVVALVKSYPQHETLLAHLQLGLDDLLSGVVWQQHINDLIAVSRAPKRTGGIGRDWSFGWTPLLTRFGQNISAGVSAGGLFAVKLESHLDALAHLTDSLSVRGQGNVALIGPDGVGKTTIIYALAEKLIDPKSDVPADLQFRQIFMLDASSLIAAAPGRGELENLVVRILGEAYAAKNVIICLDNAQLFFEEGVGAVDLSNVLLPIIEAGRLRMIFAMEDSRYLQISQRNPKLANALNRIVVAAPSRDETITVLQDQLINVEFRQNVTYMYQALQESYRLSERYIYDLAMPGRAVKLLEAAAGYSEDGLVTAKSVQQAIEKTQDIKVGVAGGGEERDKLLNLENLIHERMINQTRAVGVVSDALRRARAGVRNQDRPIGTFLFLGPTGVGKTELAKALAEVYFGGESKVIRLDMNEYVSNDDVSRLIADGATDSMSLTAQVMKQPFSVVLLDEIEKAHPNVLTTLLQMLDEGVLRDIRNREVSFKDAIIIATSNAGADRIREHIERGLDIEKFEPQLINELIDSNLFKPEFLNRFDEIVMFRPLKKDELLQVVDLMIKKVNQTLALQKVSVSVSQDAKEYLVEQGYDPRLGARPMRRVVQKAVENTVAKKMLSGEVEPGGVVEITLDQVQSLIEAKAQADDIVASSQQIEKL